jgi:hypothetical protein
VAAIGTLVGLTALCYLARVVIVWATEPTWPGVAAAVRRWWSWSPLAVACAIVVWRLPLLGVPFTIGLVLVLWRADALAAGSGDR